MLPAALDPGGSSSSPDARVKRGEEPAADIPRDVCCGARAPLPGEGYPLCAILYPKTVHILQPCVRLLLIWAPPSREECAPPSRQGMSHFGFDGAGPFNGREGHAHSF